MIMLDNKCKQVRACPVVQWNIIQNREKKWKSKRDVDKNDLTWLWDWF